MNYSASISEWRKSTWSKTGNCAEVGAWRKSTWSESGNCAEISAWRKPWRSASGNCLEAGQGEQVVGVRDTKEEDLGTGRTVLEFSPAAWREFLDRMS